MRSSALGAGGARLAATSAHGLDECRWVTHTHDLRAVDARTWSGARTNPHVMAMGSARGGCSPKGCRNGTGDLGASFSTLDRLRGDSGGDIIGLVFGFRLERQ